MRFFLELFVNAHAAERTSQYELAFELLKLNADAMQREIREIDARVNEIKKKKKETAGTISSCILFFAFCNLNDSTQFFQ